MAPSYGYKQIHFSDSDIIKNANELLVKIVEKCGIETKATKTWFGCPASKSKRYRARAQVKTCPSCSEKNAKKSTYCRLCGRNIEYVESTKRKEEPFIVTKRKNIEYPFCRYFVRWMKTLKELGCTEGHHVFPPFKYLQRKFRFNRHLTVQRFDQILHRLDITLTSHMFRYGHSEKLFRLGYTPFEVKEVGDWQSSRMPEAYAKRKGFTVSQRKFAEDVRMRE